MSYFRCYLLNTADKIVSVDSLEARDDATAMEMAGQLILSKHTEFAAIEVWDCARRWWDYTAAYQRMIEATHTPEAPWYIVPADDKRRARLNLIRHLLDSIPYKKVKVDLPKIPKTQPRPKGATERLGAGQPILSHY